MKNTPLKYINLLNMKDQLEQEQRDLKAAGETDKSHLVGCQIISLESMIKLEKEVQPEEINKWERHWYGGESYENMHDE